MSVFSFFKKRRAIIREDMPILAHDSEKRRLGTRGETLAVKYLKQHGYKITARNFIAVGAEIDVIAENRDTVAFVEVKTRSYPYGERDARKIEGRPAASVTPEKQRKILSASHFYRVKPQKHVRFDIIEVYLPVNGERHIEHIQNAFNRDTAK